MPSPIDALSGNVIHTFEKPRGTLNADVLDAVKRGALSREIHILDEDAPPRGPKAIAPDASSKGGVLPYILIHRPHLELLWAFTYGWMVLYEEAVQKPLMSNTFFGPIVLDSGLKSRAAELLSWASGLSRHYSPWPANLPSPIYAADQDETGYCLKANGVFQEAAAFLLYHEFAHVRQGHLKEYRSSDEAEAAYNKQLEREADDFALRIFVSEGDDDEVRRLKGWPLLVPVLSSLYLINSPGMVFQDNHPHLHHRIHHVLTQLNFQDEQTRFYYWYLSSVVLTVFEQAHNIGGKRGQLEPQTFETAYEALDAQMETLESLAD